MVGGDNTSLGHSVGKRFDRHGSVVPHVHSDVENFPAHIREVAVAMTMEHPRAMCVSIPRSEGVVEQDNPLLPFSPKVNPDFQCVMGGHPTGCFGSLGTVVVSTNENFDPIESPQRVFHGSLESFPRSKHEIPEVVDRVTGANSVVPLGDEMLVHLLDRVEGSIAIPQDVSVTEVSITCEPNHKKKKKAGRGGWIRTTDLLCVSLIRLTTVIDASWFPLSAHYQGVFGILTFSHRSYLLHFAPSCLRAAHTTELPRVVP